MKPNLIMLNGLPGMGKSTLSQRYANEHPLSLNLDIDRLWLLMGGWQEHIAVSELQKYKFAYSVAKIHLKDGYDVVVSDLVQSPEVYSRFERIAGACGAVMHEFVLIAPLDESIERCKTRARAQGYPTGFRPGGVLDTHGREKMLKRMHTEMLATVRARTKTNYIESEYGRPDKTYQQIIDIVEPKPRSDI